MENTNNPNSSPQNLDNNVVALMRAIRTQESGGKYDLKGQSGEFGAYQYTKPTWQMNAKKYLGNADAALTPENQNFVTYHALSDLKKQGYNPAQIASIWNSGRAEWDGHRGVNKYGVQYDVPAYVNAVSKNYQTEAQKIAQGGGIQMGNNSAEASAPATMNAVPGASQTQTDPSQMNPDQPKTVGGFAKNLLTSGAGFVGNTVDALVHPFRTVKTLGKLGLGIGDQLLSKVGVTDGQGENANLARTVEDTFKQRYGGLKNIGNTAYNDPVGLLADLATVIDGGSSAIGAVGKVGKIGELGDIARIGGKAASTIDPIQAAGRGLSKLGATPENLANKAGSVAAKVIGTSTGKGAGTFETIFNQARAGLPEAQSGLRGAYSSEDLLSSVDQGIKALKSKQNDAVSELGLGAKGGHLDLSPVRDELNTQLENFGVTKDAEGKLNFDHSTLGLDSEQSKVQKMYSDVQNWKDLTPKGIDTLKQRLSNYWEPGTKTGAFSQALKSTTRDILKQVPGYDEYAAKYGDIAEQLTEIRRELSQSGRAADSTQLKKLLSIFGEKNVDRMAAVKALDEAGAGNLLGKVAGYNAKEFTSPGLIPGIAGGTLGVGALSHPAALAGLPLLSPRLMGEATNAAGKVVGKAERIKLPDNAALRAAKAAGKQVYGRGNITRNAVLVKDLKNKGN